MLDILRDSTRTGNKTQEIISRGNVKVLGGETDSKF